jgi:hypothetical protein
MKKCNLCNEIKTLVEFGRLKSTKDGYRTCCRVCRKKYWEKPPEDIQKWKEWRKEHMRQLGLNTKGKKRSEDSKVKQIKFNEDRWKNHDYDKSAKRRSFDNYKKKQFSGSFEDFIKLVSSLCHYCGCGPDSITSSCKTKHGVGAFKHLGLDRVDNDKGYTLDNVVPCCFQCNNAKWSYKLDVFEKWIISVYNKLNLGSQ